MEKDISSKVNKKSNNRENSTEIVRTHIVRNFRRDPNAKHIQAAAQQIHSKIKDINNPMSNKLDNSSKNKMEQVEVMENSKPKFRMNIIKNASANSAKRSPGATPSWLKQAIKDKTSKKIQKEDVEQVDEISSRLATHAAVKATEKANRIVKKYNDTMIKPHDKIEGGWMVKPEKDKEASSMLNTADKRREQASKFLQYAKIKLRKEDIELEEKMSDDQKNAVKGATDLRSKIGMKTSTSDVKKIIKFVKKEEAEYINEIENDKPPSSSLKKSTDNGDDGWGASSDDSDSDDTAPSSSLKKSTDTGNDGWSGAPDDPDRDDTAPSAPIEYNFKTPSAPKSTSTGTEYNFTTPSAPKSIPTGKEYNPTAMRSAPRNIDSGSTIGNFMSKIKSKIMGEGNTENKIKKNAAATSVGSKNRDDKWLDRMNPSVADKIRGRMKMKEEQELEEGRGRPPKVGSKAWHAKQAAAKSGEGEKLEADQNIHTQLHKVISVGRPVTFNNGESHQISAAHAHKALSMLQNAKASDRLAIQNSLSHSHDRFHETLKSGKAITDAPRPKVSLASRAKSVSEERDADRREQKASTRMINGVPTLVKYTPASKEVKVEAVTFFDPAQSEEAEEKREGQGAPKGATVDMTKDSCDRMQSLSPQAFKQKFKLPPTAGNVASGGEDTTYAKGKFSVAEEKTLNNLYDNLSEENKEIFDQMLQTEEGISKLIEFARKQGL